MSWIKLNNDTLFLMKGGDTTYIDKVPIKKASISGQDIEVIEKFPGIWFESIQWPRTIVVNTDKSGETTKSFSELEILKMLAIPIDKRFYNELSKAKDILEFIEKFHTLNGDYSDSFKEFIYKYKDNSGADVEKKYRVDFLRYDFSAEASNANDLKFPTNLFPPEDDIDISFENPAFADEIFLPILNSAALTVRPSLYRFSSPESANRKIGAQLAIVKQPKPGLRRSPTTLETLEKSIIPRTYDPPSSGNLPKLGEVTNYLLQTWGIAVNIPTDLSDSTTNILVSNPITFPEVMDEIGSQFDADWDWFGHKRVRLIPKD